MIIYEDIITGHELFSDAYPCKLDEETLLWEVDGMRITIDNSIDESAIGGNASAEGGDEGGADDEKKTEINIIHAFKLQSNQHWTKAKDYQPVLKKYLNRVMQHLEESGKTKEEIEEIKKKVNKGATKILKNFKDYEILINEDFKEDGMFPLLNYREDGITPYFTYFAPGVKGVKC
jgi:hypothetical protein